MRVAVASDHAAVALRRAVLGWLVELGHEPVDFGTDDEEPIDYPDVIGPAADALASGRCERAVVLGGSGTGEAIVANKMRGVRCVHASDPVTARLGQRACLIAFLEAPFDGGRHARRVEKIARREGSSA